MNLSRRYFLGSFAAAMAAPKFLRAEEPTLKIGLLSDPHVTPDKSTAEPLEKAFRRFAAEGVGVVVISGDICHDGKFSELNNVMNAWHAAFPNGLNAHGVKVEPFFVWGNHDYHDASYMKGKPVTEEDRRSCILYKKDEAWRMVTGEEKHSGDIFLRKFHGITFIGAHWGAQNNIGAFLKEHAAEIPTDCPVIYVQHPHPRGTCFRGWASYDSGKNHAALMEHPNFFCISGHSHASVSFDDSIWSGGFVSMGAGSMRVVSGRRYEYNANVRKGSNENRYMASAPVGNAQQASILSIYSDRVVLSRHEYLYDEHLGEDWDLPFPFRHNAEKPYVIAEAAEAPQFMPGTEISVEQKDDFIYPAKTPAKQVRLSFDAASSVGPHSRAVDYRVVITRAEGGETVAERLVAQGLLGLSERRAREYRGYCAFGIDELPHGVALVATITPINAGGRGGKSISKEFKI